MGYYTVHTAENLTKEQIEDLAKIADLPEYYLTGEEECKWYSFGDDFKELSLKYPDELLIFSGEGEESGDIWKYYAKNGLGYTAKAIVTFPDFNEAELE